jgi:hypothetical protein
MIPPMLNLFAATPTEKADDEAKLDEITAMLAAITVPKPDPETCYAVACVLAEVDDNRQAFRLLRRWQSEQWRGVYPAIWAQRRKLLRS